jgi:hypothetical protein
VEWLKVRLSPGQWHPAQPIIEEGEILGFPHTGTLQRAKDSLRVQTRKVNKRFEWFREKA